MAWAGRRRIDEWFDVVSRRIGDLRLFFRVIHPYTGEDRVYFFSLGLLPDPCDLNDFWEGVLPVEVVEPGSDLYGKYRRRYRGRRAFEEEVELVDKLKRLLGLKRAVGPAAPYLKDEPVLGARGRRAFPLYLALYY